MFTTNPFAELSPSVPPGVMQAFVIIMIALVFAGTLFDVMHKGSSIYFSKLWQTAKTKGDREVAGGEIASLAVQTLAVEIATSAEFCNQRRRIAHLLTMYGFVLYVLTTAIMVFCYTAAGAETPAILPLLWHLGALMVCFGGYWFWFFIRVDVAAEGNSPFRIVKADLFILSLLGCTTFALLWSYFLSLGDPIFGTIFLALYLISTVVLFGGIPWSKFAHMFFKPAAALEKRIEKASGQRRNLPAPADKPATFGSARRQPNNY
jgi:hypothetical protein